MSTPAKTFAFDFVESNKHQFEQAWDAFVVHMETTPDLKESLMDEVKEWYESATKFEVSDWVPEVFVVLRSFAGTT